MKQIAAAYERERRSLLGIDTQGVPINQAPSAWAVYINLTDSNGVVQQLFWDYVYDDWFSWSKGVFLCHFKDNIWQRIAGCDQYPASYGDVQAMLVEDCVEMFNQALDARWPPHNTGHPVDQSTYDYLLANLKWDATTQRFYAE